MIPVDEERPSPTRQLAEGVNPDRAERGHPAPP